MVSATLMKQASMSELVVLIPSFLSTPTRADFANLLLRSIANQVEHADGYVLCVRGPYIDRLQVPEGLNDLLTVVEATEETSQLLQLRRAWRTFSGRGVGNTPLLFSFSDDDDLWSPVRIKTLRTTTRRCGPVVTAVRELQYARGESSAEDFTAALGTSEVVSMSPRGSSEYYLCTVRAHVVEEFFTKASDSLLRHSFADQAFVRYVQTYGGRNGQTAFITLEEEGPLYYYRVHGDSVCDRVKEQVGKDPKKAIRSNIHCMVLAGVVNPRMIASYIIRDPAFFARTLKELKREVGTSVIDSNMFDIYTYYTILKER